MRRPFKKQNKTRNSEKEKRERENQELGTFNVKKTKEKKNLKASTVRSDNNLILLLFIYLPLALIQHHFHYSS